MAHTFIKKASCVLNRRCPACFARSCSTHMVDVLLPGQQPVHVCEAANVIDCVSDVGGIQQNPNSLHMCPRLSIVAVLSVLVCVCLLGLGTTPYSGIDACSLVFFIWEHPQTARSNPGTINTQPACTSWHVRVCSRPCMFHVHVC